MKNKNLKNKKAFSMLEMSIVIMLIGIMVAGISKGSVIYQYARMARARSITNSSEVLQIPNLMVWFETTSENSFNYYDLEPTTKKIATWKDIKNMTPKFDATQTTDANKPTYVLNCMNSLPCLRFVSGSRMSFDASDLRNDYGYTIFIVEQRNDGAGDMLGTDDNSDFSNFSYGYDTSSDQIKNFVNGGGIWLNIGAFTQVTPRVHTLIQNYNGYLGYVFYVNGVLFNASEGGNPGQLGGSTTMLIGSSHLYGSVYSYLGDITEIIMYSRALNDDERLAVQRYLGKKWGITIS